MRELATPVPAGRQRSRRRAPKFLVGVRRVAFVLTAVVWIVALLRVSSELATPADGFASALFDTAALWALYLVLAWFGRHPPASLLHWFRSLGKARQRRDRSEMAQIIDLVSWFAAVVLVPLLGYHLLPERKAGQHGAHGHDEDIYDTGFYRRMAGWISWCIEHRWLVLGVTAIAFAVAMAAFTRVPKQFFPNSERPELLVDMRLPEGASFAATLRQVERLEKALEGRPEIEHSVSFVGSGAPRFYLPLDQQLATPNFAQLVITTHSVEEREKLAQWLQPMLRNEFPAIRSRLSRLENGPPVGFQVQFRVSGDDIAEVRAVAEKVAAQVRADALHAEGRQPAQLHREQQHQQQGQPERRRGEQHPDGTADEAVQPATALLAARGEHAQGHAEGERHGKGRAHQQQCGGQALGDQLPDAFLVAVGVAQVEVGDLRQVAPQLHRQRLSRRF